MKDKTNEIYNHIARNMFSNMQKGWDNAYVEVEREAEGAMSLKGGYTSDADKFVTFDFKEFDQRIQQDFEELYTITVNQGHYGWTQAKFNLDASGKYSLNFESDPVFDDEPNYELKKAVD